MDALFIAELNERLFTHFTGGVWRAPHSLRLMPVYRASGVRLGQIACADDRDLERARAGLRVTGAGVSRDALERAIAAKAEALARLRDVEGFGEQALAAQAVPRLDGTCPRILLSSAAMPVSSLVAVLLAGLETGLIWKPAPGAAASAHLVMGVLGPLAEGRLAMVHGDHETGAALARLGPVIWASEAAPPASLPPPVLTLAAGGQDRP